MVSLFKAYLWGIESVVLLQGHAHFGKQFKAYLWGIESAISSALRILVATYYLKPTYEGLKAFSIVIAFDVASYLKPTYEGLKARQAMFKQTNIEI